MDTNPPLFDATPFVPENHSFRRLKEASKCCEGCNLYKNATQTVFGNGPAGARLFLVGEQPGNKEDLAGEPFVGPAGQLLRKALLEAGIEVDGVYVTNAVKHFKFKQTGKSRLHQKPGLREIRACRPWLEAELDMIKPAVIVCLGATAARSVLGPDIRVRRDRGKALKTRWAPKALVTEHPSAILRAPTHEAREEGFKNLVRDLKLAKKLLGRSPRNRLAVPEESARRGAVRQRRQPHDRVDPLGY